MEERHNLEDAIKKIHGEMKSAEAVIKRKTEFIEHFARSTGKSFDEVREIFESLENFGGQNFVIVNKGTSVGPSFAPSTEIIRNIPLDPPPIPFYFPDHSMTPKEYGMSLQRKKKRR